MVSVIAALISSWFTPISLFILLNAVIAIILFSSSSSATKNHHQDDDDRREHALSQHSAPPPPPLVRAPSFFSRVSFNLRTSPYDPDHARPDPAYHGLHYEPETETETETKPEPEPEPEPKPTIARPPSLLSRVASFGLNSDYFSHDRPEPVVHVQPDPDLTITRAPSLLSRVVSFTLRRADTAEKEEEKVSEKANDEEEREDLRTKQKATKMVTTAEKVGGKKQPVPVVKKEAFLAPLRKEWDEEVDAKADDFINRFKQQLKLQRLESLLRYRNATAVAS